MIKFSYGSEWTPSISLKITSGLETANSYPSLRIVSIKILKCNSPRPETLKQSVESVSSTLKLTFFSSSVYKRFLSWREVTNLPSVPANGLSFTEKFICKVGSSTLIKGNAFGVLGSQIVSPIWISEKPAIPTISPADADSISTRPKSLNPNNLTIFPLSWEPSAWIKHTWSWELTLPCAIRPTTILPTYSL